MLPASARSHYQRVQRLQVITLASARQAWRRIKPTGSWAEQYTADVAPKLLALLTAAQVAAARESDRYMAEVLVELGIVTAADQVLAPNAFAGVAGDGRDLAGLLAQSVVHAGKRFNAARQLAENAHAEQLYAAKVMREVGGPRLPDPVNDFDPLHAGRSALANTEKWLDLVSRTVVADTVRAAESAAMVARAEVDGWVRMLNPPSCSRCTILAGKWFKWNTGFDRHPGCDCIHIPASESDSTDLRVNPDRYFHSLTNAEQDRIFTQAGAQAIRHGADIGQVVNARRGMSRAQVGGRQVLVSSEGTTRHGLAYRGHTGRNMSQRLMPETIFDIAGDDRAEAIRLLRLAGFIL